MQTMSERVIPFVCILDLNLPKARAHQNIVLAVFKPKHGLVSMQDAEIGGGEEMCRRIHTCAGMPAQWFTNMQN